MAVEDKPEMPDDFVISTPSSFRHEGHIGFDPTGKCETRFPKEWKEMGMRDPKWHEFLEGLGLTEAEMQNPKITGKLVSAACEYIASSGEPPTTNNSTSNFHYKSTNKTLI